MPVSTYITKPDNQNNRVLLDPIEIILLLIGFLGVYFNQNWIVIACILVYIFGSNAYRIKEYQRKGEGRALMEDLIFETDKIIIGSNQFDLKTLLNLKIKVWNYDGEKVSIPGGIRTQPEKGINNILEFDITGNKYSFTFYLESEVMKAELGDLLKEWYKNEIAFEESDRDGRTYGLKQLNYKQIQEFKRSIKENTTDSYS